MKILVTGGAGFIGSHVSDLLLAHEHSVVALDNFDSHYGKRFKRRNIESALRHPNYKLVEGDYGAHFEVCELLQAEKFDAVLHLAAQPSAAFSLEDSLKYERTIVSNLLSFLEALREHGPRKIVSVSSCAVYGRTTPLPFREYAPCSQPLSPYGAFNRASEIFLATYQRIYGFKALIVRPFTVYGPRQRPEMAVISFARAILQDSSLLLFGDGSTARDCVYIADVAEALAAALQTFPSDFGIYNLGSGVSVTLSQLIRQLEALIGKQAKLERLPLRLGEVARTLADTSKAAKELAFQPKVKLDEGLELTVKWLKEEFKREGAKS